MRRSSGLAGIALGSLLLADPAASATKIAWTDWTSANATMATGTVLGITVTFTGEMWPAAQTAGGVNYWQRSAETYTSAFVDRGPPDADIIRLTGGPRTGPQTLRFSAPVVDPVMAILSLGQPGYAARFAFDHAFTIENHGPGHWGNGPLEDLGGNVLGGKEGHGIIRFHGTFSEIRWTNPDAEGWYGFQVGIAGLAGQGAADLPGRKEREEGISEFGRARQ